MSYIDASKKLYDARLRKHFGRPRGCWPWTICRLEHQLGCSLPAAYLEYMRWLGAHRSGPFQGSECFPSDLAENSDWLRDLLAEHKIDFQLPTKFLVFFFHAGGKAAWFTLPCIEDDPPVWIFNEGRMSEPDQKSTFSEWLLEALQSKDEGGGTTP